MMNIDILTSFPYPLQTLVDENFRTVSVAAGDSICAALSDEGELRVWGSFRVRFHFSFPLSLSLTPLFRRTKARLASLTEPNTSSRPRRS